MGALTQYGREVANPESPITQLFRPLVCRCEDVASCQDKAVRVAANTATVTAFTYNSIVTTLPVPLLVTDIAGIQKALSAVIEKYESNPIISVEYTSGSLIVKHIGFAAITSLTTSVGAATITRSCVIETVTVQSKNMQGTGLVLNYSYNSGAVTSATLAGTYTTIDAPTAATLKTDIETALAASITAGQVKSVSVTPDVVQGYFIVKITGLSGFDIFLASSRFVTESAKAQFQNS
jgi:hypothetical protein